MTTAFNLTGIASMTKGSATIAAITSTNSTGSDAWVVTITTGSTAPVVDWTSISNISGSTGSSAQLALANLDFMIKAVDSKRAELGAVQNRFDSTIRNQSNVSENVSAARSRIRVADFATETANMTKQNILQQAASTILAQANQRPQTALSLLQG